MTAHRNRDGFALPAAIMAVLVIGAIVTGGFYAASQEDRVSASTDRGSQAFYIAEEGLQTFLATYSGEYFDTVGAADTLPATNVFAGGSTLGQYTVTVREMAADMFFIASEGVVTKANGDTLAVRRVGTITRVARLMLPTSGALSIFGGLNAGGNSSIDGSDAGGPGCSVTDSVAGVVAQSDTLVSEGNKDRITGSPDVEAMPSMDTTTLSDYGTMDLSDLIDLADKRYEGSFSELRNMQPTTETDANNNTICAAGDSLNWGDNTGAGTCGDYLPIIYINSDADPVHLTTGSGQGILIIEGNMKLTGNFEFDGIVIVTGNIETAGTGNKLEGTVISLGSGDIDSTNETKGNSTIQYSKCSIDRVVSTLARPIPMDKRSWMDLSAASAY